jgi:hypothetical protein
MGTTFWRRLLLDLSTHFDQPPLLRWEMSNGATFQMLLPKVDEFEDDSFSAAIGFAFIFDEIERIQLEQRVPGLEPTQENRQPVIELAKRHKDFVVLANLDEVIVELKRP